jgi:hypothetical protein
VELISAFRLEIEVNNRETNNKSDIEKKEKEEDTIKLNLLSVA